MNLKEAFRFQNKLNHLLSRTAGFLRSEENITKVETTYLRKKAMPEAEDETIQSEYPTIYSEHVGGVMDFALYLLDQKEQLSRAIHQAKAALPIDMDSETSLNTCRQDLATAFNTMAGLRSSQVNVPHGGLGYCFNSDGNQITYRCDARKVTTINYDRTTARKYLTQLNKKADAVSVELDQALINSHVDYEPPFGPNDTFEDILEAYLGIQ